MALTVRHQHDNQHLDTLADVLNLHLTEFIVARGQRFYRGEALLLDQRLDARADRGRRCE